MSYLMLLVLAMVADPGGPTGPVEPAAMKMSSSAGETADLDRVLGTQRVGTFDELVACIRAKNSDDDVRAFTVENSGDAKVRRLITLTDRCQTNHGTNLQLDINALEKALRGERQAK